MDKGKEVLSVFDLAQELEVGLALAYNLVREGTVPSHRIGRKYVISRRKFERWLHGEMLDADAQEHAVPQPRVTAKELADAPARVD